jgi:hypothetical protein
MKQSRKRYALWDFGLGSKMNMQTTNMITMVMKSMADMKGIATPSCPKELTGSGETPSYPCLCSLAYCLP